jgi:hypothetical protein
MCMCVCVCVYVYWECLQEQSHHGACASASPLHACVAPFPVCILFSLHATPANSTLYLLLPPAFSAYRFASHHPIGHAEDRGEQRGQDRLQEAPASGALAIFVSVSLFCHYSVRIMSLFLSLSCHYSVTALSLLCHYASLFWCMPVCVRHAYLRIGTAGEWGAHQENVAGDGGLG